MNAVDPDALAHLIASTLNQHQRTTGMAVASGQTCQCGYWNGTERPGVDRPIGCAGLVWHQSQEIAARISELIA